MSSYTLAHGIVAALGVGLALNGILWLLALNVFPKNNPAAVLHYSIDIGIDLIGEGQQITVLPLSGLAVLIGNGLLGAALRQNDPMTTWIIWSAVPVVQLVLLGSFVLIWQANT